MSTGDAGQAGQAQGTGEGEGTGGEQAQQAAPDLTALAASLQEIGSGQEELRQFLQTQPWQQQEAVQEPGAELDFSQLEGGDFFDAEGLARSLAQYVDQTAQERADAIRKDEIAPLKSQLNDMRIAQEAERLETEFPELAKPEVAQEVVGLARQMAESLGQPELGMNPGFWRIVYLAGRATDAANSEGAESPSAAHLEGAGGAVPGGGQQGDLGDLIVGANNGRGVLPF